MPFTPKNLLIKLTTMRCESPLSRWLILLPDVFDNGRILLARRLTPLSLPALATSSSAFYKENSATPFIRSRGRFVSKCVSEPAKRQKSDLEGLAAVHGCLRI